MKTLNISFCGFCDAFPESYKNNFTYEGKQALYDYLEEYEESTGEEIEMDIIAFCCEYTEYANTEEYLKNYTPNEINTEKDEGETDEEFKERQEEELRSYLKDHTQLILFKDDLNEGFIIQDY